MSEPQADFEAMKKVEAWLVSNHSCYLAQKVGEAVAEIERLRAGQFRWIALSDEKPDPKRGDIYGRVLYRQFDGSVDVGLSTMPPVSAKYWFPMPPLPERTQEEKDEAIWRRYINAGPNLNDMAYRDAKFVFMCGLKAARGEK